MSAARPSTRRAPEIVPAPADLAELRARRRDARRRRRLARVDLGLGLAAAAALLIASPGLAITGLIAALALAGCVISLFIERRTHRRAAKVDQGRRRSGVSRRT
ncbi:MAG TPA: hypothetical protein VKG38_11705 [Solirubrobacteraceae bacterium]|nr:hypothetical protein [Solirubrobacteraceae bacterium]